MDAPLTSLRSPGLGTSVTPRCELSPLGAAVLMAKVCSRRKGGSLLGFGRLWKEGNKSELYEFFLR